MKQRISNQAAVYSARWASKKQIDGEKRDQGEKGGVGMWAVVIANGCLDMKLSIGHR